MLNLRFENNIIDTIRYKYQDCTCKIRSEFDYICKSYETFVGTKFLQFAVSNLAFIKNLCPTVSFILSPLVNLLYCH